MHKNNESELEQVIMGVFEEISYTTVYGPEISPNGKYPERDDYSEVILKERFLNSLENINPDIDFDALEEVYRKINMRNSPSMLYENKEFHQLLTDGVDIQVSTADGYRTKKVWLFDFEDYENNNFYAVNQFRVNDRNHTRKIDICVFVNGIPLAVFELKSFSDENVGTAEAYNQLETYKSELSNLFVFNSLLVISDGYVAKIGTITSSEDRFSYWKTEDGETIAPSGELQLEVLVRGVFAKERFIDIIKNFVMFQTDGIETFKIVSAYHQYFAVKKAVESTKRAAMETGDRRIGVIWHTQGSGKSFSMVFYTAQLVDTLDNPTIVVVTDRNDLDDQLYTTFSRSGEYLRQTPEQISTRADLRNVLKERQSGGIIFTTIHKFKPGEDGDLADVLNERTNIVVIVDEAHRSQYGLDAKLGKDAKIQFGYAKYMRIALPNASFIGFTGTPVELADKNTPAVFGDYIDIYDMTRAVEDETTVKIFYESRIAKIDLPEAEKPRIDEGFEEITETQEEYEKEKQKSKWSSLEALAGSEKRLKLVAKDIVEHYEKRQETIVGKAMIVAMSRRIAVNLYNEIVKLRPEWHSDNEDDGEIKVVMTGSASDPADWQKHIGTNRKRRNLAKRMKDPVDKLKIVIVRDMWLTGFDVPSMHTMYVDKPMKGHNLMQAIARVNRVFKDKPGGLIVDYIGIADNLKYALKEYSPNDRKNAGIDTSEAVHLLLERYELIRDMLYGLDYSGYMSDNPKERINAIVKVVDYVLELRENGKNEFVNYVTEMVKAFALCSTTDEAQKLNVEIGFFKAVKAGIIKMIPEGRVRKPKGVVNYRIAQLVSRSIMTEEVVDILEAVGLGKPNIAILSDEFLEEVRGLKHKNLAVELLRRLLEGKVKAIKKKNLVHSKKFSEMLEAAIKKYQGRAVSTTLIITELIELAKKMNELKKRQSELNLTEDEVAFYDALGVSDAAVMIMGDDILKQIARDLTRTIRNNISVDWSSRDSVQAKIRLLVKRLLKKYKYPPEKAPQAVDMVLKQAESICEDFDGHEQEQKHHEFHINSEDKQYNVADSAEPAYTTVNNNWNRTMEEIIGEDCIKIALELKRNFVTQPDIVGYEITDNSGKVLGEAEMVWKYEKIAILRDEQVMYNDKFEQLGWKVFIAGKDNFEVILKEFK